MLIRHTSLLLLAILAWGGSARGEEADAVIDAMLSRCKKQPLEAVHYSLEGKRMVAKGSLSDVNPPPQIEGLDLIPVVDPPDDYEYRVTCELTIDFKQGRLRMDERAEDFYYDDRAFYACREIHLFDGQQLQRYLPRGDNELLQRKEARWGAELVVNLNPNSSRVFHTRQYAPLAVLLSLGILPAGNGKLPTPARLVPPIEREAFHVVGEGDHEGEPCDIVRLLADWEHSTDFWVSRSDPGKIVRCDWRTGDLTFWRLDLYYEGDDLARSVRYALEKKRLQVVEEMRVKKRVVDPLLDDVVFHMEPTVGMVYKDHKLDKRFLIEREGAPARDIEVIYAEEMAKGKP